MRLEFGRDMPGFSQIRLQNVGQRARDALRPASAKSHTEDLLSCLCLPASAWVYPPVDREHLVPAWHLFTNAPEQIISTSDGNPSNPIRIRSKKVR